MADEIIAQVLASGLEGAGLVLLLVIAYKIYKVKIRTRSECCGEGFSIETNNPGGGEVEMTNTSV